MAGKHQLLRHNKHPEFCPRHQCPYSREHKVCLTFDDPRFPKRVPFPAHPGIHAGMTDIRGRKWTHYPYEGWKLRPDIDKFLEPPLPQKHRWWCFLSSVLRGRCSH